MIEKLIKRNVATLSIIILLIIFSVDLASAKSSLKRGIFGFNFGMSFEKAKEHSGKNGYQFISDSIKYPEIDGFNDFYSFSFGYWSSNLFNRNDVSKATVIISDNPNNRLFILFYKNEIYEITRFFYVPMNLSPRKEVYDKIVNEYGKPKKSKKERSYTSQNILYFDTWYDEKTMMQLEMFLLMPDQTWGIANKLRYLDKSVADSFQKIYNESIKKSKEEEKKKYSNDF